MVNGLQKFVEYFSGFEDQYLLIGGGACDLLMESAGLEFRATKDLDIVLCVEVLNTEFATKFWAFIEEARYQIQQNSRGEPRFYRFMNPESVGYPFMLELFSRRPDVIGKSLAHLTPIPLDGTVPSLSAILLDDEYYKFLMSGRRNVSGVPIVGPVHIIALKARAWLDLTARRISGEAIDSRTIDKHRKDIIRMFRILEPQQLDVPESVKTDLKQYIASARNEPLNPKFFGITTINYGEILNEIQIVFGIL